jgi:hypothetical protein
VDDWDADRCLTIWERNTRVARHARDKGLLNQTLTGDV